MRIKPTECPNCGAAVNTSGLVDDGNRVHFTCGSWMYDDNRTLRYETDECTNAAGLREAWIIINALNMEAMNNWGEYPRATRWLHEWEHVRPKPVF